MLTFRNLVQNERRRISARDADSLEDVASSLHIDKINSNGCMIFGSDSYGYTSSNSLPRYKFFLVK